MPYGFTVVDISGLKESQRGMKKKVTSKVINMIGR